MGFDTSWLEPKTLEERVDAINEKYKKRRLIELSTGTLTIYDGSVLVSSVRFNFDGLRLNDDMLEPFKHSIQSSFTAYFSETCKAQFSVKSSPVLF